MMERLLRRDPSWEFGLWDYHLPVLEQPVKPALGFIEPALVTAHFGAMAVVTFGLVIPPSDQPHFFKLDPFSLSRLDYVQ